MKPWQINILMILGVLSIALFLPTEIGKPIMWIIFFISSFWAYNDSKKIGIDKYKTTILMPSSKPYGVFFIVLLLWLITFPMYISWRYRALNGKIPLKKKK
jgi:hypothetical protein